jgi:hypothetical protein
MTPTTVLWVFLNNLMAAFVYFLFDFDLDIKSKGESLALSWGSICRIT